MGIIHVISPTTSTQNLHSDPICAAYIPKWIDFILVIVWLDLPQWLSILLGPIVLMKFACCASVVIWSLLANIWYDVVGYYFVQW